MYVCMIFYMINSTGMDVYSAHAIPFVPALLLCEEVNARLAPGATAGHQEPAGQSAVRVNTTATVLGYWGQ